MVLQDTWLFHGTIAENIGYGRPSASPEELQAAAEATYVDRFVHSLPDGYETMIDEEGSNISAGEKQLITIARAFLADPALLILDEATSSVDTRTEVLVQRAMAALRSDRTSFVIAHRLSTIRDADVILVMEDGVDRRAGPPPRAAGRPRSVLGPVQLPVRSGHRGRGRSHPRGGRRGRRRPTTLTGVNRAGGRTGGRSDSSADRPDDWSSAPRGRSRAETPPTSPAGHRDRASQVHRCFVSRCREREAPPVAETDRGDDRAQGRARARRRSGSPSSPARPGTGSPDRN